MKVEGAALAPVEPSAQVTTEPITASTVEPSASDDEPNATEAETETAAAPLVEDPEPATPTREAPAAIRTSMEDQASLRMRENADAANGDEVTPLSPGSPSKGKLRNWLKSKISTRTSKSKKSPTSENVPEKEGKFVGGAALTGASTNNSTASLGQHSSSVRDVALATSQSESPREIPVSEYLAQPPAVSLSEPEETEERVGRPTRRASEVSSISSAEEDNETADDDDEFQEARDNFDEDLAPPPTFPVEKSSSPVRDSRFKEAI